jgi:hypothetical protein
MNGLLKFMEIEQPKWRIRNKRCECICGGEGFLYFITCPECGHVALQCDEVGCVFPNPKSLGNNACVREDECCSGCGKITYSNFGNSTGEEIQKQGFVPQDYC